VLSENELKLLNKFTVKFGKQILNNLSNQKFEFIKIQRIENKE